MRLMGYSRRSSGGEGGPGDRGQGGEGAGEPSEALSTEGHA